MPDTIKILGHTFRKMTERDYMGLTLAPLGAYIATNDNTTLIFNPVTNEITSIDDDDEVTYKLVVQK